ncbi:GerAB/ArcD/ProY family transporter [Tumebacillus permanentifrigoris]|uniref:Spore germination protein (Amino acid permease) n=1 Tax=Tumebacillus permanentifrigoris TaxID=378543 RepID=A0A316DF91_9BACL|nr:endospore germination permease [Tumebacillus permanentifrigoris]PWK16386.1 spore germination protein (amino acid permease) [Tumebacillus permanentifrigoris]
MKRRDKQDQIQLLNQRQLAWMVSTVLISGGLLSVPKALIEVGKLDAWFSQLAGMAYAFFIAYFFYQCARKFPGKNLYEIVFELCGRFFGGVINAVFLLYIWLLLVRDTRGFTDFMNSTLLLRTPEEFVMLLFTLVLAYYCKSSVEVPVRVNDLMFPLFLFVMFSFPFLLTNEFAFERLEPILGSGLATVGEANALPVGWYADCLIAGAFLHTVSTSRQIHSAIKFGVAISAVGLTMLLFLCITVLGSSVAARTMYPNYTLVEQIHITDYLDRLELVLFSIWLPSFILKCCFIFTSVLIGLNAYTKRDGQKLYNQQFAWFLQVTTLMAFHSVVEVFDFGNYGSLFTTAVLQLPFLLLLLVLLLRRKTADVELEADRATREREQHQQADSNKQGLWITKIKARTWSRLTLLVMALCATTIAIGGMLGMDSARIGGICGLVYAVLLPSTIFTTYMEFRSVREASLKPEQHKKHEQKLA